MSRPEYNVNVEENEGRRYRTDGDRKNRRRRRRKGNKNRAENDGIDERICGCCTLRIALYSWAGIYIVETTCGFFMALFVIVDSNRWHGEDYPYRTKEDARVIRPLIPVMRICALIWCSICITGFLSAILGIIGTYAKRARLVLVLVIGFGIASVTHLAVGVFIGTTCAKQGWIPSAAVWIGVTVLHNFLAAYIFYVFLKVFLKLNAATSAPRRVDPRVVLIYKNA